MALLKGSWDWVTLVCGNHEDDTHIMAIKQGPFSMFYSCPAYYPDGRTDGEPPCVNRLNLVDFEHMLSHLADMQLKSETEAHIIDLNNYEWDHNGAHFKVLSYNENSIVIRVLNKKALISYNNY